MRSVLIVRRALNKALTLFLFRLPQPAAATGSRHGTIRINQPLMKISTFFRTAVLLTALIGTTLTATAYNFEVDGIYYNKNSDGVSVSVTYRTTNTGGSYSGNVTIPTKVSYNNTSYTVTSIGENAFNRSSGLTSVTIPNSVTSIGSSAFYSCTGLTSITIPNSVTAIDNYAFKDCNGLKSINIPNSVTKISYGAFQYCSSMTSITIPNSVILIGGYAFSGCSGLTSVTIPNSVISIDNNAFQNCI